MAVLKYHMMRATYVLLVANSCIYVKCNASPVDYGWQNINDKIEVKWDEDSVIQELEVRKGCGCRVGCDGSAAGCKNCFRLCKPCIPKCKCKLLCKNPHNNGGKCLKCATELPTQNDTNINGTSSDDKGCGCKGGCDGSTAECKNCFRLCKPCIPKCKCKLLCKNPHNNGGKCVKCATEVPTQYDSDPELDAYESDDCSSASSDDDVDDLNTLPIIAEEVVIHDTELDSDDDNE